LTAPKGGGSLGAVAQAQTQRGDKCRLGGSVNAGRQATHALARGAETGGRATDPLSVALSTQCARLSTPAAASATVTVVGVMPALATLVALVVGVKPGPARRWRASARRHPATTATSIIPAAVAALTVTLLSIGHLDHHAVTADACSIQAPNRVLGISRVFKLDEREARWISSQPDIFQWPIV